ncbi:hypothetical protein, partial [Winogradskyella sp.]|uniref:hypothetical protein n=1 Tax=Winogradskyella sp. TaxID=1883156 RepID=UPI0025DEF5CE
MATRKIIGIVFSVIGILFSIIFLIQTDLNINLKEYFDYSLKSYFSLSYFNLILPLILCFILLYGGVLLIIKPIKSNPVLALFGFTVLEEIMFSWFGLISIDFPMYVVAIFFSSALLALWIAYSDTINQKRLSLK